MREGDGNNRNGSKLHNRLIALIRRLFCVSFMCRHTISRLHTLNSYHNCMKLLDVLFFR